MEHFTPAALADKWECSPGYVMRLIKSGALPAFSIGKMWRVHRTDAEAYERKVGDTPTKATCYVYIARCENFIKIGKAIDVERRMAGLRLSCPFDIDVVATISSNDGHTLERQLHELFREERHKGEWFHHRGNLGRWVAGGCDVYEVLPGSSNRYFRTETQHSSENGASCTC